MKPKFPPFDHTNPAALVAQLHRLLPPAHFFAVEQVALVAGKLNEGVMLVGGIVRDLFLNHQNLDLDFVTLDYSHTLADELAVHFRLDPNIEGVRLLKHDSFGTARIDLFLKNGEHLHIDLATSRRESYIRPAALPTVDIDPPAPVEEDLRRRDFSINALAMSLDGKLLDPFGAVEDMRDGILRVLKPHSFQDDPTRMARGLRYAGRYGYKFEEETERQFQETLSARTFELLSPERRRNELTRILQEISPERPLILLSKYNLLEQIHPGLRWDDETLKDFRKVQQHHHTVAAFLAALCRHSLPEQVETSMKDLRYYEEAARIPSQVVRLRREVLPQLVADLANSHLYALLSPFEPEAIRIATVLEPEKAPYLEHYLTRVYSLKPRLNGDFLKNLGMKPGKEFRVILDELREAVLDGLLKTEEEEANFLRSKMSQRP